MTFTIDDVLEKAPKFLGVIDLSTQIAKNIHKEKIAKFWGKVVKVDNGCWIWQGAKSKDGYGLFGIYSKVLRAHCLAFILTYDIDITGLCVLHRCDNPPCCNPDHLFLGTDRDNSNDKVAKNRQSQGETHGTAKLNKIQVAQIRWLYNTGNYTQKQLAFMFYVDSSHIGKIVRNECWKDI